MLIITKSKENFSLLASNDWFYVNKVDTLSENILTLNNTLDRVFDNRWIHGFFVGYKTPSIYSNITNLALS